jgi:phosphoribosylanthranilate isomerase
MIIQVYEIQTPDEADKIIDLGVTNVGSVVLSQADWRVPLLYETIRKIQSCGLQSSLIPLFQDAEVIRRVLDYYAPDIVHFCDAFVGANDAQHNISELLDIQQSIREKYPEMAIMRTLPISRPGLADPLHVMTLADAFEPVSDFFLIDTVMADPNSGATSSEPVEGFVGITGKICDWDVAAGLVDHAKIPVILAGGISPENAFAAVRHVRPAGVDSCTGTNTVGVDGLPIRFQKDRHKVQRLVQETRRAEQVLV